MEDCSCLLPSIGDGTRLATIFPTITYFLRQAATGPLVAAVLLSIMWPSLRLCWGGLLEGQTASCRHSLTHASDLFADDGAQTDDSRTGYS